MDSLGDYPDGEGEVDMDEVGRLAFNTFAVGGTVIAQLGFAMEAGMRAMG